MRMSKHELNNEDSQSGSIPIIDNAFPRRMANGFVGLLEMRTTGAWNCFGNNNTNMATPYPRFATEIINYG